MENYYTPPTRLQLASVQIEESNEAFVAITDYDTKIVTEYRKKDMLPYLGDTFVVREGVAQRLVHAQSLLEKKYPNAYLSLAYGYRHPAVQKKYFDTSCQQIAHDYPEYTAEEVLEAAHLLAADPTVAGHPTGGAVDITIADDTGEWDMGSAVAVYDERALFPTYADGVNEECMTRRMILHDCMKTAGFAPFYGEWWHFSYGDREWAYVTNAPAALYDQITFTLTDLQ